MLIKNAFLNCFNNVCEQYVIDVECVISNFISVVYITLCNTNII